MAGLDIVGCVQGYKVGCSQGPGRGTRATIGRGWDDGGASGTSVV